jgi:hypothetical protein
MENSGKKSAEKLRALITEPTVVINQKYKNPQADINISNFIFNTNNKVPIRMGPSDRRYLAIEVSSSKQKDFDFFRMLEKIMTYEFYVALHRFFAGYDLTGWDAHNIPFTWSKAEMITECASSTENFILYFFDDLVGGMPDSKIYANVPKGISKQKFSKELGNYTERYHLGPFKHQVWYHKLLSSAVAQFGPTAQMNIEHTRKYRKIETEEGKIDKEPVPNNDGVL